MDSFERSIDKSISFNSLQSALRAQLDLMGKTGDKLIEEYRLEMAKTLVLSGLQLIPNIHLQDYQFVVSEGVYRAAQKLIKEQYNG